MIEDRLEKLRSKWKTATARERVIIEAEAKDLKSMVKPHKHSPNPMKSHVEGNYFVFICSCGEEILRDGFVARTDQKLPIDNV